MKLVIDSGNSSIKHAVFNNNTIIHSDRSADFNESFFKKLILENNIESVFVSSVSNIDFSSFFFNQNVKYQELGINTKLPFINLYKTPETLGKDRIAAVAGAQTFFPNAAILVIDMGTAITFDFIDKNNEYWGGTISPGMNLRFKSLHEHTKRLPLIKPDDTVALLGYDTQSSIRAGVQNGIIFEINSYINSLLTDNKDLKVILTGGDANFFVKKLKNTIFAEPNLVLIGLNRILDYNA